MKRFWSLDFISHSGVAVIDQNGGNLTFRELDAVVEEWRARIAAIVQSVDGGADRVPLVALEFETSVEAISAYLAVLRLGFPLIIAEPGKIGPEDGVRKRYAPDILLSRNDDGFGATLIGRDFLHEAPPHPDLAILLSTSGSTGDPKLVRLSASNIDANARSIAEYLELTADDRAITTLPLFYSYGLSVVNSTLASGGTLVLADESLIEPEFWKRARDHSVTSLALVPHQFELLERSGMQGLDLPSLRYLTQAGGRLAPELVRKFSALGRELGWKLFIMYGQTEASPRISYVPPEALPEAAETIGRAIPGGQLYLVDEDGVEILDYGVAGELVYTGPNVMMGYALTRADLARGREVDELKTGDIAERTQEGLYRITGRLKRFAKLFGMRISLDQVETMLLARGIAANAVAVDDRLVLLVRKEGDIEAAREATSAQYALPVSAVTVAHLPEPPLLSSGKIDLRGLQLIAQDLLAERDVVEKPPLDIAALMMEGSRARKVKPEDSFTSLGGDSLGYLHVQIGLQRMLGHLPHNWENMTIAQLETLAPQEKSRSMELGSDVILRVAAISLVVAQHASVWKLYGGTWVLILLMGYSAARFQFRSIVAGHGLKLMAKMLYPILPIYLVMLAVFGAVGNEVPLRLAFLVGNYQPYVLGIIGPLWFISLYFQLVMLMAVAAQTPPIRSWLASRPFKSSFTVLCGSVAVFAALALKLGKIDDMGMAHWPFFYRAMHGFFECLPIFLTGWAIHVANGRSRLLAVALMGIVTVLLFMWVTEHAEAPWWLLGAMSVLALVPSVTLPRRLAKLFLWLASATMFIYLLHIFVIHGLKYATDTADRLGQPWTILLALALSFGLGLAGRYCFNIVDRQFMLVLRKLIGRGEISNSPAGAATNPAVRANQPTNS